MPLFGSQTITITTSSSAGAATSQIIPRPCVAILIRAPTANTDNIYVGLQGKTAVTGDIIVRPGESISLDFADHLQLKVLLGHKLEDSDFIEQISTVCATASQTLYVDTFSI